MSRIRSSVRMAAAQGIVLIDALVAILIFSIGIIGLVSLQGSAIDLTGGANNRLNAALLTDQLIAQMWTTPDPSQLAMLFAGADGDGGASYKTWFDGLDCSAQTRAAGCLPGAKAHPPKIVVTPQTIARSGTTQYQVTVTVSWQAPGESSAHSYVSTTAIGR